MVHRIEIGFKQGTSDFNEGRYCEARVVWEGITLSRLYTQYSRSVGSDHESENIAQIWPNGEISGDPARWFSLVEELLTHPGLALTTSRDHI